MSYSSEGASHGLSKEQLEGLLQCEQNLSSFPKGEEINFNLLESTFQTLSKIAENHNIEPKVLGDIQDAAGYTWDAIYAYNHGGCYSSIFKARINDSILFIQKALTDNKVTK